MLRLFIFAILASICIIQIQADQPDKSLQDIINDKLKTLNTRRSSLLEDQLSVLNSDSNALALWNSYKTYYKKTYQTPEEDKQRMKIYIENLKQIITANYNYEKGLQLYKLELNSFGDLDKKEFLAKYTGFKQDESKINNEEKEKPDIVVGDDKKDEPSRENDDTGKDKTNDEKKSETTGYDGDYGRKKRSLTMPVSLDYRPYMNPVENQGKCGSCYAFSTATTIEGAYAVKKNYKLKLSKQHIVDCVLDYGCNGGWFAETFDYIKQRGGLQLESYYPYLAARKTCDARRSKFGPIRGYGRVTSNDEEDIKVHLNLYGPLAIGVDAAPLQFFGAGEFNILDSPACKKTITHAVVLVGYGTHNGRDYWLVRNSWGPNWADHGHFKIARNKDGMCGLTQHVYYVLL